MSTTVDPDGVPLSDLSLGDVVVIDREIDIDGARTFATVIDAGEHGPLVAGPGIETATLARALTVERVTRYDQVVGQDTTGAIHLLQQGAFVDTLDVLAEPDAEPAPRQFLRDGTLQQWLRFVDERRGWQSLPERHRAVLDDVDRGDGIETDGGHSGGGSEQTVTVDDELEEAVHWVERELREARRALWDGKSVKAFASIEAAQEEFETVEEAILDD